MELQDYLNAVRRRWWILTLLLAVSLLSAGIYTAYYTKPVYEASTDLIVNKKVETGQLQVDQNSINTNLMLINTYKQIIKSPAVTKYVIGQNPGFNLTPDELSGKVRINTMKDAQVITLSVSDPSYERAATIVNAVSNAFTEQVSAIMKINNVTILNEADPAYAAVPVNGNNKPLIIAFSAIIALLIGLGIVFLLDYLDDSVRTEHDIEAVLGLPLLASIPSVKKKHMKGYSARAVQPAESPVFRAINEQQ